MAVDGELMAVRFVAISPQEELKLTIQAMIRVGRGKIVTDDALFDAGGKPCEP